MPKASKPTAKPDPFADPDIVERLFAYMLELLPETARPAVEAKRIEIKRGLRKEFGGQRGLYVRTSDEEIDADAVAQVLAIFNGRNATEVARRLNISRATVFRVIKQPAPKLSQFVPRLETPQSVACPDGSDSN